MDGRAGLQIPDTEEVGKPLTPVVPRQACSAPATPWADTRGRQAKCLLRCSFPRLSLGTWTHPDPVDFSVVRVTAEDTGAVGLEKGCPRAQHPGAGLGEGLEQR